MLQLMANTCLLIYFTICTKEASKFPFFFFFNTARCQKILQAQVFFCYAYEKPFNELSRPL